MTTPTNGKRYVPHVPLRVIREALGRSQEDIGQRMKNLGGPRLDKATVSRIETGERRPPRGSDFTLAAAYGISPGDIVYVEVRTGQVRADDEDEEDVA